MTMTTFSKKKILDAARKAIQTLTQEDSTFDKIAANCLSQIERDLKEMGPTEWMNRNDPWGGGDRFQLVHEYYGRWRQRVISLKQNEQNSHQTPEILALEMGDVLLELKLYMRCKNEIERFLFA